MLKNRELGLIDFNRRVAKLATDSQIPLLEQLNYLCIVSRNLDELFEVRISSLFKQEKDDPHKLMNDGFSTKQTLNNIKVEVDKLYTEVYSIFYDVILPKLQSENILLLKVSELNKSQASYIEKYFLEELRPVITPISVDLSHPFPRVPNKNIHFAVSLSGKDQFKRETKLAIIETPLILPRIIKLPTKISDGKDIFILLQDVIVYYANTLFSGMKIKGCFPFRVTRSSDLDIEQDGTSDDLPELVTQKVAKRKYAKSTRLELDIQNGNPHIEIINILLKQFNLDIDDLYLIRGPVNFSRLSELPKMLDRPLLKFIPFEPKLPKELVNHDLFTQMSKRDILIHTPYQSFDPVLELTNLAAIDPNVLAIKITLYRTGFNSKIVKNLVTAAKVGKQVIVSVELLARFDEEANIEVGSQLEQAGAHVVYGVMGYKVHAKVLSVIRKEATGIKHYLHLGTGNYHQTTAKLYTDFGLLTTNTELAKDIDNLFIQLTGVNKASNLNLIYQAPFTLYNKLVEHIDQEIQNQNIHKNGHIMMKVNSLTESSIIKKLYEASQAGVKIELIVRGSCMLIPQDPIISQNITVRSIVGRFLEHHRVFYFYNNGIENTFISSADLMYRNLFRRVETCIPILSKQIKNRIILESFKYYLRDNTNAWEMQQDGSYKKVVTKGRKFNVQQYILQKLAG